MGTTIPIMRTCGYLLQIDCKRKKDIYSRLSTTNKKDIYMWLSYLQVTGVWQFGYTW